MVSVFIRTYEGDLEWLSYCLASLHRNLSGWDEIVVCIPEGQADQLRGLITDEKVVTCPAYADDYIGQQVSKLQAYRHVRGEFILFVDSDVIFHPGADISAYFRDGKPVVLKESYARLSSRHPELDLPKWQGVVNLVFGERPSHEYMRRAPQLFRTASLVSLDRALPELAAHALSQPYRLFSEFNVLGYFVEKNEPAGYVFIDLEFEPLPRNPATQNWSWGGFTPEIFAQLVAYGVADPNCPPDYSRKPSADQTKSFGRWRRFRYAIKNIFKGLWQTP
jgi:glycosyltransferase involved in cell wall biosynthesis